MESSTFNPDCPYIQPKHPSKISREIHPRLITTGNVQVSVVWEVRAMLKRKWWEFWKPKYEVVQIVQHPIGWNQKDRDQFYMWWKNTLMKYYEQGKVESWETSDKEGNS